MKTERKTVAATTEEQTIVTNAVQTVPTPETKPVVTKTEVKTTPPTPVQKAKSLALEAAAILFWLYAIIKLFVFDVDNYLVARIIPNYQHLLSFKFLIIVGTLATLLLLVKTSRLVGSCVYVATYPLIVVLWKIPALLFKQRSWVLAFAFANSFISFFQSFKANFVTATVLLTALVITASSSSPWLMWASIALMLAALCVLYVRRFIVVFQPSIVFQAYLSFFPRLRRITPDSFFGLDAELRTVERERLTPEQQTKWTSSLQLAVLYNRGCLFVARKLEDYQSSKLNFLSYVFSLLTLTVITILVFAGVNLALFKIDHRMFSPISAPTVFGFVYYSFNNLFRTSANVVSPMLPLSQGVYMLEVFFEFLLGALLVSLFFSVSNERYTDELKRVVVGLEQEGESMESFVNREYQLKSIDDAIAQLAALKAGFINAIYWFSKYTK